MRKYEGERRKYEAKLAMKARLSSFILPPSSFDIGAGDEI
jgi:hypothetical protein